MRRNNSANRTEKQKQAEGLREELQRARSVILSSFEGLNVAQDAKLRREIAQAGARYKVVKNRLLERAAQGTLSEPAVQKLRGTTSLAYTETDPVALAKVLTAYAKENPALVFKAGLVEGRLVSLEDMALLANLPGRETLLSKVLYLINVPAQRVAFTISGVARNLTSVIQQGVKENKFKASTET